MNYYIGIDLGTSACKGILTNREGTVLAEHSVSYPVSNPYTNWSEQNPEDWWNAFVRGIKELTIEVNPNDTGKERVIPAYICAGNFRCPTNYIQKAE